MLADDIAVPASRLIAFCEGLFREALLGVYLHGSGATGPLQVQSDVDLLVLLARPTTAAERQALVTHLLETSGTYPRRPDGPRCLEVMVIDQAEAGALAPGCDLLYGEWLRESFAGGTAAEPFADPVVTLLLAQARTEARPLLGPPLPGLLPDIGPDRVVAAMRHSLPDLMAGLDGDERNVLLTLARMWHTAITGAFVGKDVAAAWVEPRLPADVAETLRHAARAYRGEVADDWTARSAEARHAAATLEAILTGVLSGASRTSGDGLPPRT